MKPRVVCLILTLLLSVAAQPQNTKAQEDSYRYAYEAWDDSTGTRFYTVDPANPATFEILGTFAFINSGESATGYGPSPNAISPDGRLYAGMVRSQALNPSASISVRILNFNGTVQTVLSGVFSTISLNATSFGFPEFMKWSPDGRYLAILARPNHLTPEGNLDDNTDLYVYDTQSGSTRNITQDTGIQGQFAWSPDSQKLAYATLPCLTDCPYYLDVYEVDSSTLLFSSMVDVKGLVGGRAETSLCLYTWSPDSSKLVFRVNCDSTILFHYQELHTFDLTTGVQARLTHYTQPPYSERDTSFYIAVQYPVWYDSDLILVGGYKSLTMVSTESFGEGGYIESYRLSTNAQTLLSPDLDKYIREWAPGKQLGQYAVVEENAGSNGFKNSFLRTHLVQYANDTLTVTHTLPTGCNFSWDPTKRYLSYWQYADPRRCDGATTNQVFFDVVTGNVTLLPQAAIDQMGVRPRGWVKVSEVLPTPTATAPPTNTPRPTPTATYTPTLTLTPSLTPTLPAKFDKLRLSPACSPDPATIRVWVVRNLNPFDLPFTWEVQGNREQGSGVARANGETMFTTKTIHPTANVVRLLVQGKLQDVSTSTSAQCPTPTPGG